jgi:hypothetical protein
MTRKKECDLLIAQTMEFVQSIAGNPVDADGLLEARLPLMAPDQPSLAGRPAEVFPARLSPIGQNDLRGEIRGRVAAFRARQQVFHRDREEFCNATMAKARVSSEQAAKARDHQPPKG